MIDLKEVRKVFFIGIGGIGMSALARYFKGQGKDVSGYDKTATPLTQRLEEEGIPVHYTDDPALAPKDANLVIYTPAVPKDHRELLYYQQNGYELLKRSDVLGVITNSSFNICVAGTHGKTTITTMIAHVLRHSGYGCNAFLGGISANYNTNFWSDARNVCVVEADEYDRSFLKLHPDVAVITAMDPDHLDIYGTAEEMEKAFVEFAGKVKPGGVLLSKWGLPRSADLKASRHFTYGLTGTPDIRVSNLRIQDGSYYFDVAIGDWQLSQVLLNMGGLHNVENSVAAIGVAHLLGIEDEKIKDAIAAFKGVRRRFEYIIRKPGLVFIDDYAHHPEELRALISGARGLFPDMRCTVVFQPHLFSRTRDFAGGFAESLNLADKVYLLPIYPARELPMAGVTSGLIGDKLPAGKLVLTEKEDLLKTLAAERSKGNMPELLITAGAGDIDAMVGPIREILA